jgi:SAM-dependent methyltransferase
MKISNAYIFSEIYSRGLWGRDPGFPFYSGRGSHDETVVSGYVASVRNYMQLFFHFTGRLPRVLDLGCGDFFVGRQLRDCASDFIAVDVVTDVIEFNKCHYKELDVEFYCADATNWSYPSVDIAFVRQVFQHLPNVDIASILGCLSASADHVVVTEQLPSDGIFSPNLEIPSVGNWRLGLKSGVVVTSPPFSLKVASSMQICSIDQLGGTIVSTAYRF